MKDMFQLPSSRAKAGVSREDITPPNGIYNRCWGAALRDTSVGFHKPFTATALALASLSDPKPLVLLALDLCWFEDAENERFLSAVREGTGLGEDQLIVNLAHSHSALNLSFSLKDKEGGEKIIPYFESVVAKSISIINAAVSDMQPAWISADYGHCSLAANRNYKDEEFGEVICGFNPHADMDDTLVYARVSSDGGETLASILNYGCHPTSLGASNELVSPDYIGAAREIVEREFGGLCLFVIGPCGDSAPRQGYSGDAAVADKNGRQLGFAAASVAASLLPPGQELAYQGPLISGATLAIWEPRQMDPTPLQVVQTAMLKIDIPLREKVGVDVLKERYRKRVEELARAKEDDDIIAIRTATAMAERARRTLLREPELPDDNALPFNIWIWKLGRIVLVGLPAELFSVLQTELRKRFPELCLIIGMNSNGTCAYIMPEEDYNKGYYQEWVSPTGKGGLEKILETIAGQLKAWM